MQLRNYCIGGLLLLYYPYVLNLPPPIKNQTKKQPQKAPANKSRHPKFSNIKSCFYKMTYFLSKIIST